MVDKKLKYWKDVSWLKHCCDFAISIYYSYVVWVWVILHVHAIISVTWLFPRLVSCLSSNQKWDTVAFVALFAVGVLTEYKCLLHVYCISSLWKCKLWYVYIALHVCVWIIFLFIISPVPQPPTITLQSPKDYIFDPRENIIIHCEAKGKPHPRWE